MRIVFDTNCLLRVLPVNSPYRYLWDAFLRGDFELCYTTEILHEYEEILSRFYSTAVAKYAVGVLMKAPNTNKITPHFSWNLITADPDDNKFVDCALNANADYIVTNDKHFNVLKSIDFPLIKVMGIMEFQQMLKQ